MFILHITPYYAPAWAYGGVVRAVYGLATAQAALGLSVAVLTTDTLAPGARIEVRREQLEGVNVIRCRNRIEPLRRVNLSSPVGWRQALAELFAAPVAPDILHCHELRTVENLLTLPIASAFRKRVVVSPHGTLPRTTGRSAIKRAWDLAFGRRLARRFDGVIALTASEAEEVRAWWGSMGVAPPPITVIPNGVNLTPTSPPTPLHETERGEPGGSDFPSLRSGGHREAVADRGGEVYPTVLFVGRLHERKGIQFLIPAFAQAIAAGGLANARLLIVGPDEGMSARAHQLATELGIGDRVTFTGLLTGAARDKALAKADLFVLPAVGEGLSIAALEAMAAGLPVILTPGCNLPEVEPRGAGLIVPREILPLARAIRTLLLNPPRRATMGAAGQAWMRESFAWPTIAQRIVEFYHEVLSGSAVS